MFWADLALSTFEYFLSPKELHFYYFYIPFKW
jgi:hypothetical protein